MAPARDPIAAEVAIAIEDQQRLGWRRTDRDYFHCACLRLIAAPVEAHSIQLGEPTDRGSPDPQRCRAHPTNFARPSPQNSQAPSARLESAVACLGVRRGDAPRGSRAAHNVERLLGATRLRAAARRRRRPVATVDRYDARVPQRHRPVEDVSRRGGRASRKVGHALHRLGFILAAILEPVGWGLNLLFSIAAACLVVIVGLRLFRR